ncbi:hypothetical protein SRHO_G00282970 [Serrasalmus rhombeus]
MCTQHGSAVPVVRILSKRKRNGRVVRLKLDADLSPSSPHSVHEAAQDMPFTRAKERSEFGPSLVWHPVWNSVQSLQFTDFPPLKLQCAKSVKVRNVDPDSLRSSMRFPLTAAVGDPQGCQTEELHVLVMDSMNREEQRLKDDTA